MRISRKYPAFVLFTTVLTAVALFFAMLGILESSVEREIAKRGEATVESFAMANAPHILRLPSESAKSSIHFNLLAVARNADVLNARIADTEGRIIDSLQEEEIGTVLPNYFTADNASPVYSDPRNHAYHFTSRVRYGQVRLGTFVLSLSSTPLELALSRARIRAILFAVGIATAIALLALMFVRREVQPLKLMEAALGEIADGDFSKRVPVSRKDEIGALAEAFNHMLLRVELFFQYVDKMVIERLVEDDSLTLPGGRAQELAVVFGDMRGYTSMSNRLTADEVVKLVNTYFHLFIECVAAFHGIVDKTMGDAIMAIFERERDDDLTEYKRRGVLATVTMKASNRVLNAFMLQRTQQGRPLQLEPKEFGFAVATGRAIVGNIGSRRRMDYTVCGRVVNLASRLEGLTKKGEVIVDNFTRIGNEDRIVTAQLEAVQPKGFSESEKVIPHRIIGLSDEETSRLKSLLRRLFNYEFIRDYLMPSDLPVGEQQRWCREAETEFVALIADLPVEYLFGQADTETGEVFDASGAPALPTLPPLPPQNEQAALGNSEPEINIGDDIKIEDARVDEDSVDVDTTVAPTDAFEEAVTEVKEPSKKNKVGSSESADDTDALIEEINEVISA